MKTLAISKLAVVILLTTASLAEAQQRDSVKEKSIWDKKFYWGATFNNALANIVGSDLPQEYFSRPSIGGSLKTEYYFTKNIGATIGVTFQAKGAGIITPDVFNGLGDPDSTHRARIKFYNLEIPIAVIFRGFEPIKGTRVHAELGVIPSKIIESKYIFLSVEDGFHLIEDHSDRYYKTDLFIHASLGLDINAGNSCIFQIDLYGNWGTANVYNTNFFPNKNGRNQLYGIRLGWLF